HKPPPKLAPRAPVARDRIIQKSHPKTPNSYEEDEEEEHGIDDKIGKHSKKESLYEFLKNTSPEEVLGDQNSHKIKTKSSKSDMLSKRRSESSSKLNATSE